MVYAMRDGTAQHPQLLAHADHPGHGSPGGPHIAVGDAAATVPAFAGRTPRKEMRCFLDRQPEADEGRYNRQSWISRRPGCKRGPCSSSKCADAARGEKTAAAERLLQLQD